MTSSIGVAICLGMVTLAAHPQTSPYVSTAQTLWESAVAAKGGRDRLRQVRALAIAYDDTLKTNFLSIPVDRGHIELLFAFPDRFWSWDDLGRIQAPRLEVRAVNLNAHQECVAATDRPDGSCHATRSDWDPVIDAYASNLLLETAWLQPALVSSRSERLGFTRYDVVRAMVRSRTLDYFLDTRTHLPIKIRRYWGKALNDFSTDEFSDYVAIEGIQMPRKQGKVRLTIEINPAFDQDVFDRAPRVAVGPSQWRRK